MKTKPNRFMVMVEKVNEFETILTNENGDRFIFNPQQHEGLADFFFCKPTEQ